MSMFGLQAKKLYPTVLFGEYYIPNGVKPEDVYVRMPMEWLVLEIDSKKRRALILSKYVIGWEGFADCPIFGYGYATSWDESYLRKWLNDEFYKNCFTLEEHKQIVPVHGKAANGKRIIDKVFLLAVKDVKKYFSDEASAIALEPMIESENSGTKDDPIVITYEPVTWWTRTSGSTKDMVWCIGHDGKMYELDSNCDEIGVRPAMWVNIPTRKRS